MLRFIIFIYQLAKYYFTYLYVFYLCNLSMHVLSVFHGNYNVTLYLVVLNIQQIWKEKTSALPLHLILGFDTEVGGGYEAI